MSCYMRKKVFPRMLLLILGVCSLLHALPQSRIITGSVKDQNGTPLENATISLSGGAATSTDAAGAFHLSVPPGAKNITVSYIGMKPQQVSVEGKTDLKVILNITENKLNDVVVIG